MTDEQKEAPQEETPAQTLFWKRLRRGNPDLGERFVKGTYRCPAHDDQRASLGVWYEGSRVRVKCHAGCNPDTILKRLGIAWIDLSDDGPAHGKPLEATYTYTDQDGAPLFRKLRYAGKDFRYQHYDADTDTWRWGRGQKTPHVLYRLPEVLEGVRAQERIWFVEGEKDADALAAAGQVATCNHRGASENWREEYAPPLRGAYVTVVADRDEAGRAHARKVYHALADVAAEVLLVEPVVNRPHADAADHLAAGHSLDDFTPLDPGATDSPTPAEEVLPEVMRDEGDVILKEVEATLRRYVAYSNPHHAVTVALWVAHTHAVDCCDTTGYLHFTSPEPESGKSRNLEVVECLAARAWMVVKPSEAVFYRKLEADHPTVLLDEVDELFKDKADPLGLVGILNVGYRRRAGKVPRCVPGPAGTIELQEFNVFGAKALAGIRELPGALRTRCIPIRLQRRGKDQAIERFRDRDAQALDPLRLRLAAWVACVRADLFAAEPELPEALSDRQADCWEPLLAVADVLGGDWPDRARAAAVAIHGRDPVATPSTGVLLLEHIREAFTAAQSDRLPTESILRALCDREDGPWAGWWERDVRDGRVKGPAARLRGLLKPYGIDPKVLKLSSGSTARGYLSSMFEQAWKRYLPQEPSQNTKPGNSAGQQPNGDVTPSAGVTSLQASDLHGSVVSSPEPDSEGYGPCARCRTGRAKVYGDEASQLCGDCKSFMEQDTPDHGDHA